MLLVIMTKSLIRLDSIVRASLNNDCMTNRYDDRRGRARTESDSDITRGCRGYNEKVIESITRGYNGGTRDYDSITRSYRRYNEKL